MDLFEHICLLRIVFTTINKLDLYLKEMLNSDEWDEIPSNDIMRCVNCQMRQGVACYDIVRSYEFHGIVSL